MIQNSEILITGGYGFIGSHIAKSLAEVSLGNSITILDLNVGPETSGVDLGLDQHDNVIVVEGSVVETQDYNQLPRNFDCIISAAGYLGVNRVAQQQQLTLDTNIAGTRNTLEFASQHTEKPLMVVISTSEVYGVDCASPTEDQPAVIPSTGQRWCYAASKLADEYYLRAYSQSHGIPGAIVRPFNVFGPHRYGSNAMTALVANALNDEELKISGDGQQVRSWCYIDDFCDGVVKLLGYRPDGIEAFNIGDDRYVFTMSDLAQQIIKIAGSRSKIKILHNDIEDVRYRVPNITKARELLGYSPQADFEISIDKVMQWMRETTRMKDLQYAVQS